MDTNIITIPSTNDELDADLVKNKDKYIDFIYGAFERLLNLDILPEHVKIFNFKETDLQVIIRQTNYISNIDNLLKHYITKEEYEKCNTLNKLKNRIVDTNK
tara:strand:- start:35 stop:340 length:306 start_codon:yes stop_codon:yes gene_type:complete